MATAESAGDMTIQFGDQHLPVVVDPRLAPNELYFIGAAPHDEAAAAAPTAVKVENIGAPHVEENPVTTFLRRMAALVDEAPFDLAISYAEEARVLIAGGPILDPVDYAQRAEEALMAWNVEPRAMVAACDAICGRPFETPGPAETVPVAPAVNRAEEVSLTVEAHVISGRRCVILRDKQSERGETLPPWISDQTRDIVNAALLATCRARRVIVTVDFDDVRLGEQLAESVVENLGTRGPNAGDAVEVWARLTSTDGRHWRLWPK